MASGSYKNYTRGRRQYTVDTLFSNGMSFTNGAVEVGFVKTLVNYNISNNGYTLTPRAGLRTSELILPDILNENDEENKEYHSREDIQIMAAKECIEADGRTYKQLILGHPEIQSETENLEAKLWVATVPESEVTLTDLAPDESLYTYGVNLSQAKADILGSPCSYFVAPLTKIHNMVMEEDSKVATLVGTFAFNNSFYFMNPKENKLVRTVFSEGDEKYIYEKLEPKSIAPSEAVSFGYNMLAGENAYKFVNRALNGTIQLTGILPYSTKDGKTLLMTPRKNEEIYFRCHFEGEVNRKYKFVWEWRNIGDSEWSTIVDYKKAEIYTIVESDAGTGEVKLKDTVGNLVDDLEITFKAPTENIMVRVQAFNVTSGEEENPIVEKAMTVGFDFTTEVYGTSTNIKQETYNLISATGMVSWKNRLVLWGVPKDPTILFVSDINDATYFPYPNNISVFDEPIVSVQSYLDHLLVFTVTKIYQISLNEDGTSWKTVVIQSNLNIALWDRHLIQVVRNMVFFKSGNYYFMIVPRAQSTTGELVLAPISLPMREFFNHFEKNVSDILADVFDYRDSVSLIDYYNFLDYEDVHNIYVLKFSDSKTEQEGYLHFDILYSTVSRAWRIHTYEAPHFLYPYKHDATQNGMLASTALLDVQFTGEASKNTMVIRSPIGMPEEVKSFELSPDGYEFYAPEKLIVDVKSPVGFVERFHLDDDFKWTNSHNYQISGDGCVLYSEILEDGLGLKLERKSGGFLLGSTVTIYKSSNTEVPIWGPQEIEPSYGTIYDYSFPEDYIDLYSIVEFDGNKFEIDTERIINGKKRYTSKQESKFWIDVESGKQRFYFPKAYVSNGPIVRVIKSNPAGTVDQVFARCIQLYQYDGLALEDFYILNKANVVLNTDDVNNYFGYSGESIRENVLATEEILKKKFRFKNWQFVDTGNRSDALEYNKRYRELQFQLNNIDGRNLEFGLEFQIDGQSRLDFYNYEVDHVVDEDDPNYGLLYVEASPTMNLNLTSLEAPNETVLGPAKSYWTLDQSYFPEVSLWKVRTPISGKGATPRVRLLSHNSSRFELMSIHWIYRLLYMR